MAAGAAGCFLEDQVWPKRCGHMCGKRIVARAEYLQKMQAAVEARGSADFFIVARTDALAVEGIDEAVSRVSAAREMGANASFVEAPASLEQMHQIGRQSPAPNVANMVEGGKTPLLSREELAELGFHLILYPLTGIFSAAKTMERMFARLRDHGTTEGYESELMTFAEFNDLIGVEDKYRLAERFGIDQD
jgi:methylisocitrate lyase